LDNETTIFLNDEVASSGVDDSHTGFKGMRNPPKWPVGSNACSEAKSQQRVIKKGFDDGYEIMSRYTAFGSPIANRYTQSISITSEQWFCSI
jgi:hypothetical protein